MKLRMSPALRRQVEESAKLNNRSMNAEVVSRLEASFSPELEINGPIELLNSQDARRALEDFASRVALKALKAAGYTAKIKED